MNTLFLLGQNVCVTVFEFLQSLFLVKTMKLFITGEILEIFSSYQILLTQHIHIHYFLDDICFSLVP